MKNLSAKQIEKREAAAKRMIAAWVLAKSLGLKKLTKECFKKDSNFTLSQHILEILVKYTTFQTITTNNVVMALAVCGWNYKRYRDTIYLKGKKVYVSDADFETIKSGLDTYNADKPDYMKIEL